MGKLRIILNEDHIKLIQKFCIEKIDDYHSGIDTVNPYGGSYLIENLAMILGYWDKCVEGTEKDYDGRKFGFENEQKMLETHMYLMNNIEYILSIIIQFSSVGIKPGLYTSNSSYINWEYK